MNADAMTKGRLARKLQLLVEPLQTELHRLGSPHRRKSLRRLASAAGQAKLSHQRIANELVEQPLLSDHRLG